MAPMLIIGSQSAVWAAFSVTLLAAPHLLMSWLGMHASLTSAYLARVLGAELCALAIASYVTRAEEHPEKVARLFLAYFLSNTIGAVVSVSAVLADVLNPLGWILVGLFGLYSTLFFLLLVRRKAGGATG